MPADVDMKEVTPTDNPAESFGGFGARKRPETIVPRAVIPSITSSLLPKSTIITRASEASNRTISLQDLIYFLENDVRLSRSPLMYLLYYKLR